MATPRPSRVWPMCSDFLRRSITKQGDLLGWNRQLNGKSFLGLFVEMGRIKDTEQVQLKTALRKVVEQFRMETRLTPSQNILIVDVPDDQKKPITDLLAQHGVRV